MKFILNLCCLILLSSALANAEEFKPNYEKTIDPTAKELDFTFHSGQVQIRYEPETKNSAVKCEMAPKTAPAKLFDFKDTYKKFRCEIVIARALPIKIKGDAGQIQATRLIAATEITLSDGQIQFTGDSSKNYDFDAKVEHGMSPMLPMSSPGRTGPAVGIKLRVKSGMISIQ